MGKIIQTTSNPLNPISATVSFERQPGRSVLLFCGWEQNPDLSARFQDELELRGIGSVAFSAFDTIDPTIEDEGIQQRYRLDDLRADDELLATLPPRMLYRALRLLEVSKKLVGRAANPDGLQVVTHCAGANVYMIALYCEALVTGLPIDQLTLPARGLLLEPMIAEGRSSLRVGSETGKHEKLAATDAEYISLKAMQHPNAENIGTQRSKPATDILNSRGVTMLGRVVGAGADLRVVLGSHDVAAPDSLVADITAMELDIPISRYPLSHDGAKYGHGYVFAQPSRAADYVDELLS